MTGRATIELERVLPAPPEAVFAVWSSAESLAAILCPGEIQRAEVELDFRVGGRFRVVMQGERPYVHTGQYLEIEPSERLVFSWVSEFLPEPEQRTRVSLTLQAAGAGRTRLRLVHDELPDTDAYDGHRSGWVDVLDHLEARLKAR